MTVESRLTRYLAEDKAVTQNNPIRIYRSFGQVHEIWHLDMGLSYFVEGFMMMNENEYNA